MAYKKDIRPWLKENGYTWEDMDKFWKECCEVNWKCKMIADSGKSWSDMTMYQIQQLPTLKETTLKQLKEKEEKEKLEAEEKKKQEDYEKYYAEHFEEILVEKIDKGEPLTISEMREMREYSVDRMYGENRRWQRSVTDICSMCDRYFSLCWEEGLTESQEDDFMEQPYEVFPHKTLEVKEVTKYSKVRKSDEFCESYFSDENAGLDTIKNRICRLAFNGLKVVSTDDVIVITPLIKEG